MTWILAILGSFFALGFGWMIYRLISWLLKISKLDLEKKIAEMELEAERDAKKETQKAVDANLGDGNAAARDLLRERKENNDQPLSRLPNRLPGRDS